MANKNRILDALGEAREHLILNKNNEAMMLMAQITIDVIEHLTDEALIVSKGYEEDLKTLKSVGVLTDDTAHNFETLIISGVQAHNGVDIPKEHAEQALQVLTNELDLIFKNDDKSPILTENLEEKAKFNAQNKESTVFEYDEDEDAPYPGDFSKDMTAEGATPAFMQKGDEDEDFRKKERMREQMLASERHSVKRKKSSILAILIPIVLVFMFAFVVRGLFFSGRGGRDADALESNVQPETFEIETTETESTEPPLPPESGYYDVTGDLVKIRNAATTEGSRVLGTVSKGDKVHVRMFYNDDWAVVIYEGREAYISRRYIVKDESIVTVSEESAQATEE